VYGLVPVVTTVEDRLLVWPLSTGLFEAETIGATSAGFTVTVGCEPLIVNAVPTPFIPLLAAVTQVYEPVDAGFLAENTTVTVWPEVIPSPMRILCWQSGFMLTRPLKSEISVLTAKTPGTYRRRP
jgi:hypothetical protein